MDSLRFTEDYDDKSLAESCKWVQFLKFYRQDGSIVPKKDSADKGAKDTRPLKKSIEKYYTLAYLLVIVQLIGNIKIYYKKHMFGLHITIEGLVN